jgi:quinohemoprotein ethanol dehydrogenase
MRTWRLPVLALTVGVSLVVALAASAGQGAVSPIVPAPAFSAEELIAPSADNWLGYNGSVYGQRYSTLEEINASNVRNLRVAWRREMKPPGTKAKKGEALFAEMTPIAHEGVLYMPDGKGNPWAIDGGTGERIWATRLPTRKTVGLAAFGLLNRGAAIGDGKIYLAAPDASISAFNQATGRQVWRKVVANKLQGHAFTNALTYYDGKLLTGSSGGDAGAPAFVIALNAKTGRTLWKFNVIPQNRSDPGWNSWPAKRAFNGGGAMWNQLTVDPELGLVYGVTGNPIPYSGVKRGRGQELFTESIIALNVNTGKLRWYHQAVHHDIWDYDSTNATILFDRGELKGVAYAGKTGWVYAFDRRTGKPIHGITERKVRQAPRSNTYPTQPFVNGDKFSEQCPQKSDFGGKWPMAPDGKPYKTIGCMFAPYDDTGYTLTRPSALGGANWPPSAYSPDTGYMYICSKDSYMSLKSLPAQKQRLAALGDFFQLDEGFLAGEDTNPALARMDGRLVAMNLRNNRIAWQVKWPNSLCYSGVATTAGNLVFVGRNEGYLEAYHARTGKRLWRSPKLKAGVNAAPAVYSANGKQYVVVHAGGNAIVASTGVKPRLGASLYAFALRG